MNEVIWLIQELTPKIQPIQKTIHKKSLSQKKKLILVNNLLYHFNLGLQLLDRVSEKFHVFEGSFSEDKKELEKNVRVLYDELKKHGFNCYPKEILD